MTQRKIGQDLLDHMEANKGAQLHDIVRSAGYWRKNGEAEDGSPRISLCFTQFWNAYAHAQGHEVGDAKPPTEGRKPIGVLKLGRKGLLPVSGAYTKVLNITPGEHVFVDTVPEGQTISIVGPAVICRNAKAVEAQNEAAAVAAHGEGVEPLVGKIPAVLQAV